MDTFSTAGPEGPGTLSRRLFGVPGPKGRGDSCKGRAGLQPIFPLFGHLPDLPFLAFFGVPCFFLFGEFLAVLAL